MSWHCHIFKSQSCGHFCPPLASLAIQAYFTTMHAAGMSPYRLQLREHEPKTRCDTSHRALGMSLLNVHVPMSSLGGIITEIVSHEASVG